MNSVKVSPEENNFGASITGVNLANSLSETEIEEIRSAWVKHRVVYFPDQPLNHEQLAQFTLSFGQFGDDPYVKAIEEHANILEVRRDPDEDVAPFGGGWHSDWSFQATPPSATILHSKVVPPIGGDTWYADGLAAYDTLDQKMKEEIDDLTAIHSARRPYSHEGYLQSRGPERSMTILPSEKAMETQEHPLVRTHPESGEKILWINLVYTLSIKELSEHDSQTLLSRLFKHALEDRFIYKHKWKANMLTMWDNRSVQHCAQGGYDGHLRVMHRTTVAGDAPYH
tara:strand:- start:460 stop:1311 length:852 start_codon:yes stop_codon:yes gene_type:complete